MSSENLDWFQYHRTILSIPDSPEFGVFEAFTRHWPGCTAECSVKLDDHEIHPARFNLLSTETQGHQDRYGAIEALIQSLTALPGITLNDALLRRFCDDWFQWRRVVSLFCGVDLRQQPASSRFKVWFGLHGWREGIERALDLGETTAELRRLVRDRLLVGFDLRFDGHSAVKCYSDVRAEEIAASRTRRPLAARLSPGMMALADQCRWIHVTDDVQSGDPVVHLHPREPNAFFADLVTDPRALDLHAQWAPQEPSSVCLAYRDGDNLRPSNLYWKR